MRSMLDAAEFHGASIDMKDAMGLSGRPSTSSDEPGALAEGSSPRAA